MRAYRSLARLQAGDDGLLFEQDDPGETIISPSQLVQKCCQSSIATHKLDSSYDNGARSTLMNSSLGHGSQHCAPQTGCLCQSINETEEEVSFDNMFKSDIRVTQQTGWPSIELQTDSSTNLSSSWFVNSPFRETNINMNADELNMELNCQRKKVASKCVVNITGINLSNATQV